jgi:hypothetical protein
MRKQVYQYPFTREELYECYVIQWMTWDEMRNKFHVAPRTLVKAIWEMGIHRGKRGERRKQEKLNMVCVVCNTPFQRDAWSQKYRKTDTCSKKCTGVYNTLPISERLIKHIKINPKTNCWEWTGTSCHGRYGMVRAWGKKRLAHRVSYQIFRGEIPDDLEVLHGCDNGICINPDHLHLGTHSQNMKEAVERGRINPSLRSGENHPMARLTETIVRQIRERARNGERAKPIADAMELNLNTVCDVITGRTWKQVV